jgi:hypothetical protein
MRYLIAMLVAIAIALPVTLFVSPWLSSLVVARFSFDSPDEVGNLEDGIYMLTNLGGLAIGWTLGWIIGGRFATKPGLSS